MDTVLGLLGMAVYMAAVIGLACAVTFAVVKLSPSKSTKDLEAKQARAQS